MSWQSRKPHDASVYVIEDGGLVKVGSSWQPDIRHRRQIKRGRLAYATPYIKNGRIAERMAHCILREKGLAVEQEWFSTTAATAIEAVKAAVDALEQPLCPVMKPLLLSTGVDYDVRLALRDYVQADPKNRSNRTIVSLALREFFEKRGVPIADERTLSRREREKKEGK